MPVQIDSQGFRMTQNSGPRFAPPRLHVICSGDSTTFRDSAADNRTWCPRLAAIDSGLATVDIGQGGWPGSVTSLVQVRRNGLSHKVRLFTFVANELLRMPSRSRLRLPKPLLIIRNDSLAVENTPVPPFRDPAGTVLDRSTGARPSSGWSTAHLSPGQQFPSSRNPAG